jgi:hypothetical protein
VLAVTTCALHYILDLELHLLQQQQEQQQQQQEQQQQQQGVSGGPVQAMTNWLQAAWHTATAAPAADAGGIAATAAAAAAAATGPAAMAAAVAAAKAAAPSPTHPTRLALRLLEHVALLVGVVLGLYRSPVGDRSGFVLEVLGQLRQGLSALQHSVVAVEASGDVINCRRLLLPHAAAVLEQQRAAGGPAGSTAATTIMSLVQLL